jgi:hypothetical protein
MLDDGRLDPLAILTMCDTMPGRSANAWAAAAAATGSRRAATSRAHARRRAHRMDPRGQPLPPRVGGYASAEMEIWDGTCEHLVAYATQQMVFVFPDGPPRPRSGCRSPSL